MDAVERHGALHALDHAALFWTGALTWVSLLGVDPVRGSPGPIGLMTALVAWMAPMALLGAFYTGATRVLVAAYAHGSAPLADQHTAGMVMWLGGMAVVAPVAVVATIRGLWAEEQRQRRREQLEALR
jgi:cytochrome c oxidase assembly factor CtaG